MAVTITLTLAQETDFFNQKIKNKVYEEIMTTVDIIDATGGSHNKKAYHSLLSRYIKKSSGQILSGGRHTPFIYFFPVSSLTSFLIKPYHCPLLQIANHYVSVEEANSIYRNYSFTFEKKKLKIHFADIFGLGTFSIEEKVIPFIIQRYSTGTKLTEIQSAEGRHFITFLPRINKHLAKQGIIIDPYNQNWFIHGFSLDHRSLDYELLEYVDLAYMHSLDTNYKVQAVIESLKPLNFENG
ncbi:MAG: hypothetical protein ACW99R_10100 [Candidatus Hodarchaeales archaeon]|jgi:hypothetical protein